MATVKGVIKRSMRLLGAISSSEDPSSEEQADALSVLNSLLDSWSLENLMIYSKAREEFSLSTGKQTYTMGDGADFDTVRPLKIEQIVIIESGASPQFELPVDLLTKDEWAVITVKDTESDLPTKVYVDYAYPNAKLNFWPLPSEAKDVGIYSRKPLEGFENVSDTVSLPPGYQRALEYNLAVEMAPEFGLEPSPTVQARAVESKGLVKTKNSIPHYMAADEATQARGLKFNWLSGE